MRVIVNLVAFQVGWLACVLGGAHHLPWAGVGLTLLIVAIHLKLTERPAREARLLLAAAAIGVVWDGLLVASGLLTYPSGMILPWLPPVWIVALWVLFATMLNVTLRWLHGRWILAALFGAVGGPMAFYAGSRLGGVAFGETLMALAVIAAGWSVLTPLLVWLARRLGIPPAGERSQGARAQLAEAEPRV